jgi:ABC-type sugar transport system ATPase subunit
VDHAPRLRVSGLTKRYGASTVLRNVSLSVAPGEVLGLIGENGAGKSTLLRIVASVVRPTSGHVEIDGEPVVASGPIAAMRLGVRMVHQELSLVPELTVAENFALADADRERISTSYHRAVAQTAEVLDRLNWGLDPTAMVSDLSLAERSLVEIAKALSFEPRILLLDEPTAALSTEDVERLFQVIRTVSEQGTTVIFVSHRIPEVYEICERLAVLKDGVLVRDASRSGLPQAAAIAAMVGRELPKMFPSKAVSSDGDADAVFRLEVVLPRQRTHCALEVRRGEIVGIGGLEGQGQHDLLRSAMGLEPASGWVEVDGRRFAPEPRKAVMAGMAYVPADRQNEGLALHLSVQRNMETVLMRRQPGLFARVGDLGRSVAETVARLALKAEGLENEVGQLSGGNQQKVVLGRWLMTDLRVLLLDEPTRGVDVTTKADVYARLRALASDGTAVVFASTDMLELIGLADRVLVMRDGRMVGELVGAALTEDRVAALAVGHGEAERDADAEQ